MPAQPGAWPERLSSAASAATTKLGYKVDLFPSFRSDIHDVNTVYDESVPRDSAHRDNPLACQGRLGRMPQASGELGPLGA